MKKIILILTLILTIITPVMAYTEHAQLTDLYYSYTSNNATQCNITTINTPYGMVEINQIATKSGQTFNNTILGGNLTNRGVYCFNILCTDGVGYQSGDFCREVRNEVQEYTTGDVLYLAVFVFLIIIGLVFNHFVLYRKNRFFGNLFYIALGLGVLWQFPGTGFVGLFISLGGLINMVYDLIADARKGK